MTKTKLVVLVGSYFATALLGYEASHPQSKIGPSVMSIHHYGDTVNVEGSWRRVGGHDMTTPQPNVARIQCDARAGQCTIDEVVPVEILPGYRHLRLLDTVMYRIVSSEGGILIAQAVNSSDVVGQASAAISAGAGFTDHDITLRVSVKDESVTRTWHGKRMGKGVDLSGEWLEESLK